LDSECGRYFVLKMISAAENSHKFQKTRFWKEKSVENVVTLGPTDLATLVNMILLLLIVSDWPIIMISPDGLLLIGPNLFAVPVSVF